MSDSDVPLFSTSISQSSFSPVFSDKITASNLLPHPTTIESKNATLGHSTAQGAGGIIAGSVIGGLVLGVIISTLAFSLIFHQKETRIGKSRFHHPNTAPNGFSQDQQFKLATSPKVLSLHHPQASPLQTTAAMPIPSNKRLDGPLAMESFTDKRSEQELLQSHDCGLEVINSKVNQIAMALQVGCAGSGQYSGSVINPKSTLPNGIQDLDISSIQMSFDAAVCYTINDAIVTEILTPFCFKSSLYFNLTNSFCGSKGIGNEDKVLKTVFEFMQKQVGQRMALQWASLTHKALCMPDKASQVPKINEDFIESNMCQAICKSLVTLLLYAQMENGQEGAYALVNKKRERIKEVVKMSSRLAKILREDMLSTIYEVRLDSSGPAFSNPSKLATRMGIFRIEERSDERLATRLN